jgi:hypothetical protein
VAAALMLVACALSLAVFSRVELVSARAQAHGGQEG